MGQVAGPREGWAFQRHPQSWPPVAHLPETALRGLPSSLFLWSHGVPAARNGGGWGCRGQKGKQESQATSGARQRASATPGFCPPPTAIPTPQGTVKSQDSAGRGLEVPGGAQRGQRWSFHGSSSSPGLPSPPAHPMYLGLGFTPETWVSSPHSCHRDPASTLTRAKQGVRVGLTMSRAVPSSPDIATAVRSARFQPGECQSGHTVQPGITWQAGVGSGQRAPLPRPQMK